MKHWRRFLDWLGWKFNSAAHWCFEHSDESPKWIVEASRPREDYENGEF